MIRHGKFHRFDRTGGTSAAKATGVPASFTVAEAVQPGIHSPKIAAVPPEDGGRIVADVVVGQLPQPGQTDIDAGRQSPVGFEGVRWDVHRVAPGLT